MKTIFSLLLIAVLAPSLSYAKLKVGQPFPMEKLPVLNSTGQIDLNSYKGKVVIVDLWASWCEPCKVELPELSALYPRLKNQGVEIIGINVDDNKEDALGFLKDHPMAFPLAYDGQLKKVLKKVEPPSMPSSYIVDTKGVVRFTHHKFVEGDSKNMAKEALSLLGKKK